MMNVLEVSHLKKIYKKTNTEALRDVNFTVENNEFVAIMGESGSGKSTLLNIIATLDKASSGQILINHINPEEMKSSELAKFRREKLGFVFQDFNLIETFNVKDNILLPLVLSDVDYKNYEDKLKNLAGKLGLEKILDKNINEISGGEKQRTAIARALITSPAIILADEPTGQLDSKSASLVMEIFSLINEDKNTILMVTHSIKSASYANRVLFIKDGIIYHEIYRGDLSNIDFAEKISNSLALINREGE